MSRREPYWYLIILIFFAAAALFGYHLATGFTPPRAVFVLFGFSVYWYAVWIIVGTLLGAWVVARLADERARRLFEAVVPAGLREQTWAEAGLSDEEVTLLAGRGRTTLGDVLFDAGLDSRRLAPKLPEQAKITETLARLPGVAPAWLTDAPWRVWNPDHVWNALVLILILGLIGARLYHILTPSPSMAAVGIYSALDYFRNPIHLLNFRGGGLGVYGGIAGGALAIAIYTRRNRLPTLGWADLSVVGLALGQAIGRWGNFFNQELYGRPTDLPWAIYIEPAHRLPDLADFSYFHPAFLYESLWSLLTFFLLLWLARRAGRFLPGELMAVYLVAYALGRSLLELVRLDSRAVGFFGLETGLAVATVVSLVLAAVAIVAVAARRLRRRRLSAG